MRSYFSVGLIVLTALAFIGCNSSTDSSSQAKKTAQSKIGPETTYPDGARRVTTAELAELMKNDEAFVVDVRNTDMFNAGHIPGAKLIPSTDILKHVDEMPKDKLIVTYCS